MDYLVFKSFIAIRQPSELFFLKKVDGLSCFQELHRHSSTFWAVFPQKG